MAFVGPALTQSFMNAVESVTTSSWEKQFITQEVEEEDEERDDENADSCSGADC